MMKRIMQKTKKVWNVYKRIHNRFNQLWIQGVPPPPPQSTEIPLTRTIWYWNFMITNGPKMQIPSHNSIIFPPQSHRNPFGRNMSVFNIGFNLMLFILNINPSDYLLYNNCNNFLAWNVSFSLCEPISIINHLVSQRIMLCVLFTLKIPSTYC